MRHFTLFRFLCVLLSGLIFGACVRDAEEITPISADDLFSYRGRNSAAQLFLQHLADDPAAAEQLRHAFPRDRLLWDLATVETSPVYGMHYTIPILGASTRQISSAMVYPLSQDSESKLLSFDRWELLDADLLLHEIPFNCRYLYSLAFVRWRDAGYNVPATLTAFADRLNQGYAVYDKDGNLHAQEEEPRQQETRSAQGSRSISVEVIYTLNTTPFWSGEVLVVPMITSFRFEDECNRILQRYRIKGVLGYESEVRHECLWFFMTLNFKVLHGRSQRDCEQVVKQYLKDLEMALWRYQLRLDAQWLLPYVDETSDDDDDSGGSGGGITGGTTSGGTTTTSGGYYPANPRLKLKDARLSPVLDKITRDCMGEVLIKGINHDVNFIKNDTKNQHGYKIIDGRIILDNIYYNTYRIYVIMEELIHAYQLQHGTEAENDARKLNKEIEAKVGWLIFMQQQGLYAENKDQIKKALGGSDGVRIFQKLAAMVLLDASKTDAEFLNMYRAAGEVLRRIDGYGVDYPFLPDDLKFDVLHELRKNCKN